MANFTNTEIKDTYQRVLQIDGGVIQNGLGQTVNGSINSLTGSFSGSFSGDGSGLTNLPSSSTFPFTGDAQITGSLIVSGSFIPHGTGPTTNVVIGEGAAPVLGSGGGENIVIGKNAGEVLSIGDYNILIGTDTGKALTSAYQNVVIGRRAGQVLHNSNAIYNVIIGADAGQGAGGSGHAKNVIVGFRAGYETDGDQNVYIGNDAAKGTGGADAAKGVAIGSTALYSIRDGNHNNAIGMSSLYSTRDGSDNIGLGYFAGYNIQDGSGNIIIGSGSLGEAAMSNQLRIGNSDTIAISASLATGDIILKNTTVTNLTASSDISSSGTVTAEFISASSDLLVEGANFKMSNDSAVVKFKDKKVVERDPLLGNTAYGDTSIHTIIQGKSISFNNQVTASVNISSSATIFGNTGSFDILIGDGSSLTNLQRPITSSKLNFSASVYNAGYYFRAGGNVTCSIGTTAATGIPVGTEYEFFQTSSAGYLCFTTASGVTLNSKGGNIKLAGQFSAATLKKVGSNEYDLIGDLG